MSFIPLMSPNITDEDINAVVEVLRSGMLVQGKNVEALEQKIADLVGTRHAVAVSNGTATLHLALVALGIGAGDEVIVPAFSYVATANAVEIVGAKCVFVDIESDTFNIDVRQIDRAITPRTKAIIPVHEFGLASEITEIMAIARQHDLFVIEDAACALGAMENNRPVGSFGHVGSFSFHPRKNITSGEGGILTTDDDDLARTFRQLRNHGIEMRDGKMDFVAAGFNYRMTDFQAALVFNQLARLDDIIARRRELAFGYIEILQNISDKISLPSEPAGKRHIWQTFHVLINDFIARDDLIESLKNRGIGTNYGAQCIPAVTYYRQKYALESADLFPNALRAFKHGLALPLYEKLTSSDLHLICRELTELIER